MSGRMDPEVKAARAEARRNAWKIGLEERCREEVAKWPPMTYEQAAKVRYLLFGEQERSVPRVPSEYELEQRRLTYEREAALKEAQKLAAAMTACDVCNLQPDAHRIRRAQGVDFHDWTPGRAQKILDGKGANA